MEGALYFGMIFGRGKFLKKFKFPRIFDLSVHKECSVEMMRRMVGTVDGRERLWRRQLLAWEEESVRECSVLLLNIVLQDIVEDTRRWLLDPIHGYLVRGAYRFLTTSGELADRSSVLDIWHRYIPSKVSVFLWRLLRNRLPTKDNLVRRNVLSHTEAVCVSGCGSRETTTHLFFGVRCIWVSLVSCLALVGYLLGPIG